VLERAFFARPTVTVARELVGCRLLLDGGTAEEVLARIVEVEAYLGTDDGASHAHRGPTPRAAIMFGEAGHLYVYLSYGMHACANLVTEAPGTAGAVLLRAAAVESGEEAVRARRDLRRRRGPGSMPAEVPSAGLLRGPGNLCCGLGIGLGDNRLDVCAGTRLVVLAGGGPPPPVVAGPRVGITRNPSPPLRFAWAGHPAVSAPRPR
jgi:DNA-3-methyladenine glycosylase